MIRGEMLHYTESGLDNIWLANGFEVVNTDFGKGVMVHNPSGLHQTIAMDLCKQECALNGAEFRFLRTEMNLSQAALADLLKLKPLTVANYEKNKGKRGIPSLVDVVMRSIYLEYISKNSTVTHTLKQTIAPSSLKPKNSFKFNRGRWFVCEPTTAHTG